MFDVIAPRYDFINKALALNLDMSWRRQLVELVTGPDGALFRGAEERGDQVRILDLATGTADVAILLGEEAKKQQSNSSSGAEVLGVDPSQNMLDVGRDKVRTADLSGVVSLKLGDARRLSDLRDSTFDAATMSFGIRNVPEKEQALCEIHRVLKKPTSVKAAGSAISKLAIMEFSEPGPDSGIMGFGARLFIRHVVPIIGALLSGAPREYLHLQNSIGEFPSPDNFKALMEGLHCPVKEDDGEGGVELDVSAYGTFRVEKVVHLNFGSVQIYLATPILRKHVTE